MSLKYALKLTLCYIVGVLAILVLIVGLPITVPYMLVKCWDIVAEIGRGVLTNYVLKNDPLDGKYI